MGGFPPIPLLPAQLSLLMVPPSASPKALSEHLNKRVVRNATEFGRNGLSMSTFQKGRGQVWTSALVSVKRLRYYVSLLWEQGSLDGVLLLGYSAKVSQQVD